MKTNKRFLVAIATVLFAGANTSISAKSWRIHNMAIYKPHFTSINDAMASENVQDGDTLYLDPGSTISGTQNVTKRVTIIGPGYFQKDRFYGTSVISGDLNMKAAISKIEGVHLTSYLYIAANEVTVERCHIYHIEASGNNAQNATIKQCYLNDDYGCISGSGAENTNSSGWRIEGCILDPNYYAAIRDLYCATIVHNYIRNRYSGNYNCITNLSNSLISDNIIHHSYNNKHNVVLGSLTNCSVRNNVLSCEEGTYTQYPQNICIGSSDFSQVLSLTNIDELMLVDGSPAINYATDGFDCGPTGGQYPYVSGGRPWGMPWYPTSIVATAPKDGKVNVNIQIQVQDE